MTDDRYEELLELLHLNLLAGGPDTSAPHSDNQLDAEIDAETLHRLAEAEDCLRIIERVRQAEATPSTAASTPSALPTARPVDTAAALHGGARIDRFTILRTLGQGGQAIVFLAWDPKTRREVALKTPRVDALFSSELRQRFVREGIAAARLSHPHIVTVFEVGEAGPVAFIVSAYGQGRSLAAVLAEHGPVPIQLAARWVSGLAEGVEHAHRQGIWHRDIKPGNVLLEPNAGGDRAEPVGQGGTNLAALTPKLTDFGLAKVREHVDLQTRSGALLGTPTYMAPELVDGCLGAVGPATDVYGLGVILYEMLTGAPPFRGGNDADVMRQVASGEVPSLRKRRPELPRDLEAIVLKCLEKSSASRYASAHELADDLERFLRGEPTRARPAGPLDRSWKWARRRPARSIALGLALLLPLLATGGLLWHREALDRADTVASELRKTSQDREQQLAETRYASDVRLAYRAWESRDALQAVNYLLRQVPARGDADRRGFLWWRLWSLIHGQPRTIGPADGSALSVAFSPDGATLATAGEEGTVKLWGAHSGALTAEFPGHTADVNGIDFSPDGKLVASASDDGTVRIWSVAKYSLESTIHTAAPLNSVLFLPDGKSLISGDDSGQFSVWDLAAHMERHRLTAHAGEINQLALSPRGDRLATAGSDGTIGVWDVTSLQLLERFADHDGSVTSVAFSPDGSQLASAGVDHTVRIWQVDPPELLSVLRGHTERVDNVAFVSAGLLASAGKDGTLRIWDTREGRNTWTFLADPQRIWGLRAHLSSGALATAGARGDVRLWSIDQPRGEAEVQLSAAPVTVGSSAFSPDGKLFAFVLPTGHVGIIDLVTDERRELESPDAGRLAAIWFSPDSRSLYSASQSGALRHYDLGKQSVRTISDEAESSIEWITRVSPNGQRCVTFGRRGDRSGLLLRDLDRIDLPPRQVPLPTFVMDATFVPNSDLLLVLLDYVDVHPGVEHLALIEWTTGQRLGLPWSQQTRVDAAAFTADGEFLALSSGVRQVWVRRWSQPLAQPLVLQTPQQCERFQFVPFEPFLIGIGSEGSVTAWNFNDGEPLTTLGLPQKRFKDLVFDNRGSWLALTIDNYPASSSEMWLLSAHSYGISSDVSSPNR